MDMITVHLLHPSEDRELTLRLPRDTRLSALTAMACERKFVEPQTPGYSYLYQDHLCGTGHTLGDYIPAEAAEITLRMFGFPAIMV